MQTTEVRLTATIARPETLHFDDTVHDRGIYFGRITYVITRVPVDVPRCDILNITRRQLSCRANPANIYHFEWPSLVCAARR